MSEFELYLSLGSDTGDRMAYMESALKMLDERFGCRFNALSSFIETEPWGFESDKLFLNAVVMYKLQLRPGQNLQELGESILDKCKDVERRLGRCDAPEYDSSGKRIYHSRTIDIDILFIGNACIDTCRLTVPHRLIKERDFVMIPLKEIVSGHIIGYFPDIFE